jgi:hypothetical protein
LNPAFLSAAFSPKQIPAIVIARNNFSQISRFSRKPIVVRNGEAVRRIAARYSPPKTRQGQVFKFAAIKKPSL